MENQNRSRRWTLKRLRDHFGRDEHRLAALAVQVAQERAGGGWRILGAELRDALVCQSVVDLLNAQEPEVAARVTVDKWQRVAQCAWLLTDKERGGVL